MLQNIIIITTLFAYCLFILLVGKSKRSEWLDMSVGANNPVRLQYTLITSKPPDSSASARNDGSQQHSQHQQLAMPKPPTGRPPTMSIRIPGNYPRRLYSRRRGIAFIRVCLSVCPRSKRKTANYTL